MSEPIYIELAIVEPVELSCGIEPTVFLGTKQIGPSGKEVELQIDGTMMQWRYVTDPEWQSLFDLNDQSFLVTFEALEGNGDVGTGANQVARGNHDHEIGDMTVIFNNQLI